jgi:hypothetical protein
LHYFHFHLFLHRSWRDERHTHTASTELHQILAKQYHKVDKKDKHKANRKKSTVHVTHFDQKGDEKHKEDLPQGSFFDAIQRWVFEGRQPLNHLQVAQTQQHAGHDGVRSGFKQNEETLMIRDAIINAMQS